VIGIASKDVQPSSSGNAASQSIRFGWQRGVTLIDLVIALLVMGVLTTIAVASYREYVRRGNITNALAELDRYGIRMTKGYQDNGNYGVGACAATLPASIASFNFGCELTDGNQGFTVTATGTAGVAGYTFSLNQDSGRMTTSFPGVATPVNCWMTQANRCL
jgi:type IV pilus assembly protein PilE